jgi:hypothetical protein
MSAHVKACPRCGKECHVYKCECDGRRNDPVDMPAAVAERLRELHRVVNPPRRLTATTAAKTIVWVEDGNGYPTRVRLRPDRIVTNDEAASPDGWIEFSGDGWRDLEDVVRSFLANAVALGRDVA